MFSFVFKFLLSFSLFIICSHSGEEFKNFVQNYNWEGENDNQNPIILTEGYSTEDLFKEWNIEDHQVK